MNCKSLLEIKKYLGRDKHFYDVLYELRGLVDIYKETDELQKFEYVPVKIVACFQEFFRGKYKEIMDDPKFRGRIRNVKALKNIGYDFDILGAFQDNEITLGDYLSYLIPCSRVETIDDTISQLLNIDFLNKIKEKTSNPSELLQSIDDIFDLRHMYCHEISAADDLDYDRVKAYVNEAYNFLLLANDVIIEVQFPDSAKTTVEMINETTEEFERADEDLKSLIERIRALQMEGNLCSNSLGYIESWKLYRESKAKSEASLTEGGSIYPVVYTQSMINTTNALMKELKAEYKYALKESLGNKGEKSEC